MSLLALIGLFAILTWVFNLGKESGYKHGRKSDD